MGDEIGVEDEIGTDTETGPFPQLARRIPRNPVRFKPIWPFFILW
jgi:hypothetical protein